MENEVPGWITYLNALAPAVLALVALVSLIITWNQTRALSKSLHLQATHELVQQWSKEDFREGQRRLITLIQNEDSKTRDIDFVRQNFRQEVIKSDRGDLRQAVGDAASFCEMVGFSIDAGFIRELDAKNLFSKIFEYYANYFQLCLPDCEQNYPHAQKYARRWYGQMSSNVEKLRKRLESSGIS